MLLEISVPVYRKDKYARLEKEGKIQVSSEVDTLSDGYKRLKKEIDDLMAEIDGQTRLADEIDSLQCEIENKSHTLSRLVKDIEKATEHYKNLKILLTSLGVDPTQKRLTIDTQLLLSDASVAEVEVTANQVSHEF
jgi:seryl-tRNA synthetase